MTLKHFLLISIACIATLLPQITLAERGRDGQVSILYSQAPSILNPYLAGGIKDVEAASLILEPLARYDGSGTMVPWLAETIPTVGNGGVRADMTAITWRLRDGLTWSDGTPVTSQDIRFTWAYCTAEGGGCSQLAKFDGITNITTPDQRTAVITFDAPKPFPYATFVGAQTPIIQSAQFADCLGPAAPQCTQANFNPIGTGPYRVKEFRPNDTVLYEANPAYRDSARPAFETVLIKGGVEVDTAARAVLETGQFDYAWNLQLPPDVLRNLARSGDGQIVSAFGTLVERLALNRTDPSMTHGEARSTRKHPHPILSDPSVRQALSMAINRQVLVEIGYGDAGRPSCNILPAPAIYASKANETCLTPDMEGARVLLDQAGWLPGADGIRAKDGTRLRLLFQTASNPVRQNFQDMIKQWWRDIGVETELRSIDPSVFFGSDPASPDTFQKFFADVQMFANKFDGTDPEAYMAGWGCNKIPSPENQWQGINVPRYCDEAYDRLIADLRQTATLEERAAIARAMNDRLVQSYTVVPLVDRGRVSGHVGSLGGVVMNPWDSELWNIAEWYRKGD